MERRQGTLDQVFRARKRKLTTPPTSTSSKSKKITYDRAFEDEVGASPAAKGNLEAFLFTAKHGDPHTSTDRVAGQVPENGVPQLRRGEVEFSSRKQWLTPCSLLSRPGTAEAARNESKVEGTDLGSRQEAAKTSIQSPVKTQIIQPVKSPVKTQIIQTERSPVKTLSVNSEAVSLAVKDCVTGNSSTSATGVRSNTENRDKRKCNDSDSNQLSQFANEFLSLYFSGITPSSSTKETEDPEIAKAQQSRKEVIGEYAGKKALHLEQQPSFQNQDSQKNGQFSEDPLQRSDANLERAHPKALRISLQSKMGGVQSHSDSLCASEMNRDYTSSDGQTYKNIQTESSSGAILPPFRGQRLSRSEEWTGNGAFHQFEPSVEQRGRVDRYERNSLSIPQVKAEGLHTSKAEQRISPLELDCTQTNRAVPAEVDRDPHLTAHHHSSTPVGKGVPKSSGSHEGGHGTPFTPNSNLEGKLSEPQDPNHSDSYYRSSVFSPGDEFWDEAIQIVMASKVDLSPLQSEVEKSNRSSAPRRVPGGVLLRPPPSKGKSPVLGTTANDTVKSHQISVSTSLRSSNNHQVEAKQVAIPEVKLSALSKPDVNSRVDKENGPECPTSSGRLVDGLNLKPSRDGAAGQGRWLSHLEHNAVSPLRVQRIDFSEGDGEQGDIKKQHENRLQQSSYGTTALPSHDIQSKDVLSESSILPSSGGGCPDVGLQDLAVARVAVKMPTPKQTSSARPNLNAAQASSGELLSTADAISPRNEVNALVGSPSENANSAQYKIASSMLREGEMELSGWLPPEVCAVYAEKGLKHLYSWQVECLQLKGVLDGKNLVFGASTSAGKSLVAELLMIRRIISTGRMALLVLPFVSICSEKAAHLEALLEPLRKRVRNFFGSQGSASVPKDTAIAVCTIEKANSLINKLLEENRLSEVGVIVIDELHMVGDRDRGYLLELLLTKVRYACGEFDNSRGMSQEKALANAFSQNSGDGELKADLQIIGMSATMPNIKAVAHWLQAACYETDFRPVPLQEFIKVGNRIYNGKMEMSRVLRKGADLGGKDPDHLVELCHEIVKGGQSVLVFCASRKACEASALHIAKHLPSLAEETRNLSSVKADDDALEELRKSTSGLDPVLEQTLPSGVAYHHAGLTVEEREVVERCFKQGLVRVLTATSTLAAGVNLPARRVIFRQPRIGRDFLDGTRYRQMSGRAGRAGIDTQGESIAICKPEEVKRMVAVMSEGCEPLQSCLTEDKIGMTRALLEVVAGGIVQSTRDVDRYVRCTLFNSTKSYDDVVKSVKDSLRWLELKHFVEWGTDTKVYSTTPLGRAAFSSSLTPEESLVVFEDLAKAREGFVLASDLHLVYQVTPIHVELEPDWSLYYQKFVELSELEQAVGNRVGVLEPVLMRMAHGAPMGSAGKLKGQRTPPQRTVSSALFHGAVEGKFSGRHQTVDVLRVCKRFFVALMLSKLVQEVPLMEVSSSFKVPRGNVQALQASAGRFAAMVSGFCERLKWHDLEGLVSKFQSRVSFGVRSEIVELTEIPFVKGARARSLYQAGFRTVQAVAEATSPELVKAISNASTWSAQDDPRRNAQHYVLGGVVRKIQAGAKRIVFDRAEEARIAAFSAMRALGVDIPSSLWPSLQSSLPAASAAKGLITNEAQTSGVNSRLDAPQIDSRDLRPGNIQKAKLQDPSRVDHAAPPLITCSEKDEQGRSHSLRKDNQVPDGRREGLTNESSEQLEHKSESVVQKCKRVAGSSLNCFVGGMDFLNENSLDKVDTRKPVETSDRAYLGPVDVDKMTGGFEAFFQLWISVKEFCFDLNYKIQKTEAPSQLFEIMGIAICWQDSPVYYVNLSDSIPEQRGGHGTSVDESKAMTGGQFLCQNMHPAHDKEMELLNKLKLRWKRICGMLNERRSRKVGWNLKSQIRSLQSPAYSLKKPEHPRNAAAVLMGVPKEIHNLEPTDLGEQYVDVRIIAWLLWPDEESSQNFTLEQEVKKRLPGPVASEAARAGRWTNQVGEVSNNGCCRRAAQIRALHTALWKLLSSEALDVPLLQIEMPMVKVLASMESFGVGVNMDDCDRIRQLIENRINVLEARAPELGGTTFALGVPSDVGRTLYDHLKLPVAPGTKKGKHHPSTNKQALEFLRHYIAEFKRRWTKRIEYSLVLKNPLIWIEDLPQRDKHPIAGLILEHRKLSKLLHGTLFSIITWAKSPDGFQPTEVKKLQTNVHQIFGNWLQTSTATGRLSMEEPNLQCVENTIHLVSEVGARQNLERPLDENVEINTRQVFVPTQEGWTILSADYSQIEVRLLAHFSEDLALIELLRRPSGDLFRMIASQWTGVSEGSVSNKQREHAKRLVYGILYGMGVQAVSEQLECSIAEASLHLERFKSAFPGVHSWLQQACLSCRKTGYVRTLGGRKRFLEKINDGTRAEQAKAERQAVNSICQGSASDLIKMAMIKLHAAMMGEGGNCTHPAIKGRCRLLLQIHDELVLEVDKDFLQEVSDTLRVCMEGAASLKVPLRVKIQVGDSWGTLSPLDSSLKKARLSWL